MGYTPETEPVQVKKPDKAVNKKHTPRQKLVKYGNRRQKPCPYPKCNGKVTDLCRHFKSCHSELNQEQTKEYIDSTKRKGKIQRTYLIKICCMPGCGWTGKRPDVHLMAKQSKKRLTSGHNMDRASALKMAKLCQLYITTEQEEIPEDEMTGTIKTETLVKNFEAWLLSYEAGKIVSGDLTAKKKKAKLTNVSNIAHHVRTIIQLACGNQPFRPSRLRMLRYLNHSPDKSGVIDLLSKDLTWQTIRNYLASYSHFLAYMKSLPEWCMTWATKIELESINVAYARTMTAVCKLAREEEQKRKEKEHFQLVDLELIAAYLDSSILREARKMCLTKLKPEDSLSQILHRYNNARNHLILAMTLTNAKRTKVLSSMLISEVNNAICENGVYTFDVLCDKTDSNDKVYTVTSDQDDFDFLHNFINHLRPSANPICDNVIVNMNGQATETTDINRYLKTAWNDFEEELGISLPPVTCSIIRKTWMSKSLDTEVTPEQQMSFAMNMNDSLNMPGNHYSTSARRVASVRTRTIMKGLLSKKQYDSQTSGSETEKQPPRPITPKLTKRKREPRKGAPTPKKKKKYDENKDKEEEGAEESAREVSYNLI